MGPQPYVYLAKLGKRHMLNWRLIAVRSLLSRICTADIVQAWHDSDAAWTGHANV